MPPQSAADFARSVLDARLDTLLDAVQGVDSSRDPAHIHQARVWSRRTRAALSVFAPVFDGEGFREIAGDVKQVARALGAARDLDVMAASLNERAARLPWEQRGGVLALTARLGRRREALQTDVEAAASAFLARRPQRRLAALHPAAAPDTLLAPLAAGAVRGALADIEALTFHLPPEAAAALLHAERIRVKRARYVLDVFGPLYPPDELKSVSGPCRSLQDRLGAIHDADVAAPALLAELRRAARPREIDAADIDLEACQGLLAICAELRRERSAAYAGLAADLRALRSSGAIELTRSRIANGAMDAIRPPAPRDPLAARRATRDARP